MDFVTHRFFLFCTITTPQLGNSQTTSQAKMAAKMLTSLLRPPSFGFKVQGNGEGEFDCLAGVAVNKIGQYIIADRYNHRIQIFDAAGHFIRSFGSQGTVDGKFSYPWGITTDALGLIYVCDKENHRVQVRFPQILGSKIEEFSCLVHKLSVILTALQYKPQ